MTPSEKLNLIKKISKELDKEDPEWINLTLKQFKITIKDVDYHSFIDYITKQIQNVDDDKLIDLASHLKIKVQKKVTEIKPTYWKDGFFRLFISHLASEKENAELLKSKLKKYGITCFVAHSDIEPTKEWQMEIEFGLQTCDALVALMVNGFQNSNWTDQEIGFALGRELLILPVKMGKDPYGFIGKFQAITFKNNYDDLAANIFNLLLVNEKTKIKMATSIIHNYEISNSFTEAKENYKLVEQIAHWDNKLIKKRKSAENKNTETNHSRRQLEKLDKIVSNLEKKYNKK
ncbi:MAG TPA: toll/interleukin-1 receptor domain-containing protein [Bacteroidia bacterium]|nr:toll/interleukin-1 receptor domain-containing protein [Bacteroidia bacterium]